MLSDNPEYSYVLGSYEIIRLIGKGTFSNVYEARSINTGNQCALKVLLKDRAQYDSISLFENELETLSRFSRHENVLRLFDAYETTDHLVIVTEYLDGGDLFKVIRERGRLSEPECRYVLKGILKALEHVHVKYQICHRDLKLENILLSSDGRVVLADFGLSKMYRSALLTRCGSEEYAAPELILGKPYDAEKSDIWSFGVIMFACLKGHLPFRRIGEMRVNSCNPLSLYAQILSKHVIFEGGGITEECKGVLERTLEREPSKRATIKELLSMSFFI